MFGILYASFGTSHDDARARQIDAVAAALRDAFPGAVLEQAFTSGMIRRSLDGRGIHVPSVPEALRLLADAGVDEVLVQPGHLLPGEEFDKLSREVASEAGRFASVEIAQPLLASTDDLRRVAGIMVARFPARPGTAVVLMGHGTPAFANVVYAALDYQMKDLGRADIHVATVEAYPALSDAEARVRAMPEVGTVILAPLMLVAGDHATNDMAGDEADSWASTFRAHGYEVVCDLTGLGELPEVQALYVEHARSAARRLMAVAR